MIRKVNQKVCAARNCYKAAMQLSVILIAIVSVTCSASRYDMTLHYKRNPAPDGHRCGLCPTYFQKICAFNLKTNATFIFDNHCVMDLYNCIDGTDFIPITYDKCLYFGNFAYVHGYKFEDEDYGEDHIIVKGSKKNPDLFQD